jgi:hypothetical protein
MTDLVQVDWRQVEWGVIVLTKMTEDDKRLNER